MKTLTMITRHGVTKDEISAYTLISSDYQTVTMQTTDLFEAIKSNRVVVTNMAISAKGLISTNGALDKYTFINVSTNQVEGTPRAVILDRVEKSGKLLGYTVFTQNGQIREFNVVDASLLASKGLISNGKIRHTQEGDTVSAIGGTYPLRTIAIDKAPTGKLSVEVMYFSASVNRTGVVKYAGAVISGTSAVVMSRVNDKLTDSNAKVKAAVAKLTGNKNTSSLAIQRMGANSVYGVFDLDSLDTEIKLATDSKAKCNKNLLISVIDYATEDAPESVIKMDKTGAVTVAQEGSANGLKAAKAYAEEIKNRFAGKLV